MLNLVPNDFSFYHPHACALLPSRFWREPDMMHEEGS